MDNTNAIAENYINSIERHIPIPSPQKDRVTWAEVISRMQIGDSIMFPDKRESQNFAAALRNYGFKSVVRTQKSGAVRVWKMEPRPEAPK